MKLHPTVLACAMASGSLLGQVPLQDARFTMSDAAAVLEAFEGYNHALVTKDYSTLTRDHLAVPFTVWHATSNC